ncbi:NLI interacting factor-like phosphatase-domain-containing protein [Phycomyces nitens]|nr:NLI interacting factor-like phosphatase-domain-containing protein [Phycomyces nitens]
MSILNSSSPPPAMSPQNNGSSIILRKRDRLFLGSILHFIALAYEYFRQFFYSRPLALTRPKSRPATVSRAELQYYKGKTLVLDLDETLVHSVRLGSPESGCSVNGSVKRKTIEVQSERQSLLYEVYKRPHVDFFLKTISQWYKVVIYTASMAEYANPVIDWLDQSQTVISQRYFRQACIVQDGNFLKDISLAEPDLSKVCLVDNSPEAFGLFQENGISLPGWVANPNDECLLDLLPILDALRFTADVRSVLRLRKHED